MHAFECFMYGGAPWTDATLGVVRGSVRSTVRGDSVWRVARAGRQLCVFVDAPRCNGAARYKDAKLGLYMKGKVHARGVRPL